MNSTRLSSPDCLEDTEVKIHELYAVILTFFPDSLYSQLSLRRKEGQPDNNEDSIISRVSTLRRSRQPSKTRAPRRASCRAVSKPTPALPPVTTATCQC